MPTPRKADGRRFGAADAKTLSDAEKLGVMKSAAFAAYGSGYQAIQRTKYDQACLFFFFFLIVSLPPSSYPLQIPEVSQGNTILVIYADVHDSDVTVYIDADVTSCIDADVTAYIEGRRLYPTALTILLLGCLRGFWKSFEIGMFVI